MNYISMLLQKYKTYLFVGIIGSLVGFVVGAGVIDNKQMVVIPIESAKFTPFGTGNPAGAEMAVLWGDPTKGPSTMLLKFKKGRGGDLHLHSSDYHLVMLKGTMKHWGEGEKEVDAKPLNPGSYWFQPGNKAHADTCLTEECLMFIKWEGKRDGRVAKISSK